MFSTDTNELNHQELYQLFNVYSGFTVARYCAKHDPAGKLSFEIVNHIPGSSEKSTFTTFDNVNTPELKHIITAFQNPHLLDGSMAYFVDGNKIYQVKDGQITRDTLGLAPYFQTQGKAKEVAAKNFHKLAGQYFYRDICKLKSLTSQIEDGKVFESNKYLFHRKDSELVITSKMTNQEILNSQGFTKEATQEDVSAMNNLAKGAGVLRQDGLKPKPTVKFKL